MGTRIDRPLSVLVAARPGVDVSSVLLALDAAGVRMSSAVISDAQRRATSAAPDACVVVDDGAGDGVGLADTLSVCAAFKASDRTRAIPLLVLTARAANAVGARLLDAGADCVLPDATDPAGLRSQLRALVRRRATGDAPTGALPTPDPGAVDRDDLLTMLVHNLKSPLTGVFAPLEMLRDGDFGAVTEAQRRALDEMAVRGEELNALIDGLLQVRELEAARVPLVLELVDAAAFLGRVHDEWAFRLREAGSTLAVGETAPGAEFLGDRSVLARVFGNLIDNALIHGGRGVRIGLAANAEGDRVRFSVTDDGPGVPLDHQETIFRPFRRVARRGSPRVRGWGLGLAFCRLAVEAHGGRIWVESDSGNGSAFHVQLPAARGGVAPHEGAP